MPHPPRASRDAAEIRAARVSVFEVELDLGDWEHRATRDVPGFAAAFTAALPATAGHKCVSGVSGDFHADLHEGTSFGHVIEHVLLELLNLALPGGRGWSGWTQDKGDGVYVIHYGAPDFLTGRLAAVLAVDLVKQLIRGEAIDLKSSVDQLRDPLGRLALDDRVAERGALADAAASQTRARSAPTILDEPGPAARLPSRQQARLISMLNDERGRLTVVHRMWRRAFAEYGGSFARGIIDKVELLNVDRHLDLITARGFAAYGLTVRNLSRLLCSCRVPSNFTIHSCWLYKNHLLLFVLYTYMDEPEALRQAIRDVDDLYAVVMREIAAGYADHENAGGAPDADGVCGFRELHKSHGAIVVGDDDEMSRRAVRDILEFNGYRAITLGNGLQLLGTVARMRAEIDLLLLDLDLPGMSGREVCERVRALYPEIPIVLASSLPQSPEREDGLRGENVRCIGKPFRAEELLAIVRAVIAAREPGWDAVAGGRRELESAAD